MSIKQRFIYKLSPKEYLRWQIEEDEEGKEKKPQLFYVKEDAFTNDSLLCQDIASKKDFDLMDEQIKFKIMSSFASFTHQIINAEKRKHTVKESQVLLEEMIRKEQDKSKLEVFASTFINVCKRKIGK